MTPNKEDYLKCIYELGQTDEKITNKKIADKMQFSQPAVSEMMKKMVANNLVLKNKKTGYLISLIGQQMVASLYRKHRLIEVFLVHHLEYPPDEIHKEAEILEHTVSERFIHQLDRFLNYPSVCPHGGSIPKEGRLLVERYQTKLKNIEITGDYRLVRIHDDSQLLEYLEKHQMKIGDKITLLSSDSYTQLHIIETKHKKIAIPDLIARNLYVEKV